MGARRAHLFHMFALEAGVCTICSFTTCASYLCYLPIAISGAGGSGSRAPTKRRRAPSGSEPPETTVEQDIAKEELLPPPSGTARTRANSRASKSKDLGARKPTYHSKPMKDWPTQGYAELRQRNQYMFHREPRWKDPKFYSRDQRRIFEEIYMTYKHVVCP